MRNVLSICVTVALISALTMGSCTIYYFDKSQPVDVEDTYKLPNKLTGSWYIKDSLNDPPGNWDSLSITKSSYLYLSRDVFKEATHVIEADSTVFIADDKIYIKENGTLTAEIPFSIVGDSMLIYVEESEFVEFGPDARLRQIEYGYILNTRHEHLDDWWELKFIDTRDEEKMVIRSIADEDLQHLPPYETLHGEQGDYLRASYTRKELKEFIDKGGFSNVVLTLEYNERLD